MAEMSDPGGLSWVNGRIDPGSRPPLRSYRSAVLVALAMPLALLGGIAAPCQAMEPKIASADEPLQFTGYVVDQAQLLNSDEKQRLTLWLGRFQRETGHQLAVVTVKTLHGEDVKDFTMRLANRWGVGRKDLNDGIVILVAANDRKARIAVGIGLEQRLPDAFCQQVMSRIMVPAFAKARIGQGIERGVSAIIERLQASAPGAR
ncbi:uncharacterized protein QE379_000238 [Sphingomonas sp. SORGH_AS 879]|nr:uncharacterized protein [Sphingomonas sp. SORGH_AS_0879]